MSAILLSPPKSLYDALFEGDSPRIIAAVGGGGKTTFLKTLAAELSSRGAKVLITTTTKMHQPEDRSLLGTTTEEVFSLLEAHPIVWAGQPIGAEKITGIPGSIPRLIGMADYILIEADGSRKRPIKMTDFAYEPSIPPEADAVVALAGLDGLGKPVSEAVHRPALACSALNIGETHLVTPDIVARLLHHCYAPSYVLLNKADTPSLRKEGLRIAALLPQIRCLITSLRDWGHAETR